MIWSSLTAAALSCLVAACADDRVVVTPLAAAPVAAELLAAPARAACARPDRDPIDPRALEAARVCSAAEADDLAGRLGGLQAAVRVRERAVAEAVRAAGK